MCENKKQYYGSLNVNRITDNKTFWRVVKQNFSNKIVVTNKVILRMAEKLYQIQKRLLIPLKKFD